MPTMTMSKAAKAKPNFYQTLRPKPYLRSQRSIFNSKTHLLTQNLLGDFGGKPDMLFGFTTGGFDIASKGGIINTLVFSVNIPITQIRYQGNIAVTFMLVVQNIIKMQY